MNVDWLIGQGLDRLPQFLTALAIGLLIGLERERNPTAKGGLRTFALIALAGAAAAVLAETFSAPSIVGVGLGAVALTMIAAYYHHHEEFHDWDPGTTTIAAAIACYLLAAMVIMDYARLAVILAILVTVLLYFKAELRGVARNLERRDLISIFQFAVITFVVLPLLPDRGFGPYEAFNPRHVWHMVVLISSVSLAGYVALRIVGPARGALLLGLFGGLVSSTATTLSFSRLVREHNASTQLSATVIIAANLVLLLRVAIITAVVSPSALVTVAPALGVALLSGSVAYMLGNRRNGKDSELSVPSVNNPSELRTALGFATLYAAVLLLSAWLVDLAGSGGIYAIAVVSGLTDVDAITLSTLRLFGAGTLSIAQVATAIVLAVCANIAFKLAISFVAGSGELFRQCVSALAAVAVGAWVGIALFT